MSSREQQGCKHVWKVFKYLNRKPFQSYCTRCGLMRKETRR